MQVWETDSTINISTHILTKRMTVGDGAVERKEEHFNSHPHEEDDYTSYMQEH